MASIEVGVGVTMHERGERLPGIVVRVEDGSFWFELDEPRSLEAGRWVYQADLLPEGVARERHGRWLVEVGVRRAEPARPLPPPGERTLADLDEAVSRLEPFLLKTEWPPMTCTAIPGVKRSAAALAAELDAFRAADEERERLLALRARLHALRAGFRRAV